MICNKFYNKQENLKNVKFGLLMFLTFLLTLKPRFFGPIFQPCPSLTL